MASAVDSSLPLFPSTFKRLDSRPDGRRPCILVWVFHCVCGFVFSDFQGQDDCIAWKCPRCKRVSWFRES